MTGQNLAKGPENTSPPLFPLRLGPVLLLGMIAFVLLLTFGEEAAYERLHALLDGWGIREMNWRFGHNIFHSLLIVFVIGRAMGEGTPAAAARILHNAMLWMMALYMLNPLRRLVLHLADLSPEMAYNAFFGLYFLDVMAWVAFCVFFLIRPSFLAAAKKTKDGRRQGRGNGGTAMTLCSDSPGQPPVAARMAIWFVLGLFMMGGGKRFERYLFPDVVANGDYLGISMLAAMFIWVAGLGTLLGVTRGDGRHGIRVTGWSMVVALSGFAAGAATYLAVKAQAPALLASEYGSMIPFLAAAGITVAGMVWMFRAWSRLHEIDEAEEEKS